MSIYANLWSKILASVRVHLATDFLSLGSEPDTENEVCPHVSHVYAHAPVAWAQMLRCVRPYHLSRHFARYMIQRSESSSRHRSSVSNLIRFVSVFMALSTVFHSINSLSAFSLCSSGLYHFMKVSLSPDIILCGWLGLKHKLIHLLLSWNTYFIVRLVFWYISPCGIYSLRCTVY